MSIGARSFQKKFAQGTHGSMKTIFDKLVLVNAEDLEHVDFACMISTHFEVTPMNVTYDKEKKTLTIYTEKTENQKPFSYFRQINYGISGKHIDFCDPNALNYKIKDPANLDLTKSKESFILVNQGKARVPDLNVTLSIIDSNILNVKWTFDKLPTMYRKPFEVPTDIIDAKPVEETTA